MDTASYRVIFVGWTEGEVPGDPCIGSLENAYSVALGAYDWVIEYKEWGTDEWKEFRRKQPTA